MKWPHNNLLEHTHGGSSANKISRRAPCDSEFAG